jgi:hypothetical protein
MDGERVRGGGTARHAGARLDGGARHMGAEPGPAPPDAGLAARSRHCNPVLLGSCPPACLRHMGSARASRSGWSPDSESKEFVEVEPRGATSAEIPVLDPDLGRLMGRLL